MQGCDDFAAVIFVCKTLFFNRYILKMHVHCTHYISKLFFSETISCVYTKALTMEISNYQKSINGDAFLNE